MNILQDEERIIAQAIKGNDIAFGKLFKAYQNPVYNFVFRILGNEQDAADATQEVFFKVYKKIKTLRNIQFFSTWLFSIAKNEAITVTRRRKNKVIHSFEDTDNNGFLKRLKEPEFSHPDRQADHLEFETVFQQVLVKVPENYRAAFVLGVLEEKSYDEVAKIMNCSVGNVKSRVFRARAFISKELEKIYAVKESSS